MSNKPLKKSDLNKSWMKPRRDRETLLAPENHLIVSEGTKTEPNYFCALRDEINLKYRDKINICIPRSKETKNTISLFEYARELVNREPGKYQHVWLVYDKDDFPSDNFDNTEKMCNSSSDDTISYHALWSNECIEYWFLLHFIYLESNLHRTEYYVRLSEKIGQTYSKNSQDMYNLLKPCLQTAIKNATAIIQKYDDGLPPSQCAPATKVYEIFEKLKPYISS